MPKVIQYERGRVSEAQSRGINIPVVDIRQPSKARGQLNVGNELRGVAANIRQANATMQAFRHQEATTQAEEALNSYNQNYIKEGHDEVNGYFNTRSKAAYMGADAFRSQNQQYRKDLEKNLSPLASEKFKRAAAHTDLSNERSIVGHAAAGYKSYTIETIDAGLENNINASTFGYRDPEIIMQNLDAGFAQLDSKSKINGTGADKSDKDKSTFGNVLVKGVLDEALEHSTPEHVQYMLNTFGDYLEGNGKEDYQQKIDGATAANEEVNEGLAVSSEGRSYAEQYAGSQAAMLSAIKEAYPIGENPEHYKKLLASAKSQWSTNNTAANQERAKNWDDAVIAAGQQVNGGSGFNLWASNNPQQFAALKPSQKNQLVSGKFTTTNNAALNKLYALPFDEIKSLNVMDHTGVASPADLKQLQQYVNKVNRGDMDPKIQTRSQAIASTAEKLGIKKGSDQETLYHDKLRLSMKGEQDKSGPMTHTEEVEFIKSFSNEFVVENYVGYTRERGFSLGIDDSYGYSDDDKTDAGIPESLMVAEELNLDNTGKRKLNIVRKQRIEEGLPVDRKSLSRALIKYVGAGN